MILNPPITCPKYLTGEHFITAKGKALMPYVAVNKVKKITKTYTATNDMRLLSFKKCTVNYYA